MRNSFAIIHNLQMELDPWEWTQNQIRREGTIEPLTTDVYRRLLTTGDVYVDVGAHVGFHTLIARHCVGPDGFVIAVEPQPYNCAKVLTNWRINNFSNLIVHCAAVSNEGGFVTLHDQPAADRSRLSIVSASLPGDEPQRFRVPLVRLDEIIGDQKLQKIKLLKIDTEGHEWAAIEGLGEAIRKVDNFIIEIWDPTLPDYQKLIRHLKAHDYKLRTVDGDPWDERAPLNENNLWALSTSC